MLTPWDSNGIWGGSTVCHLQKLKDELHENRARRTDRVPASLLHFTNVRSRATFGQCEGGYQK